MDSIERILNSSKKLYDHLSILPESENRDDYIELINTLLEEREQALKETDLNKLQGHQSAELIIELDKVIRSQLNRVMDLVKQDMKYTKTARKTEQSYLNPYSATTTLDGRYFDKKK